MCSFFAGCIDDALVCSGLLLFRLAPPVTNYFKAKSFCLLKKRNMKVAPLDTRTKTGTEIVIWVIEYLQF